MKRKPFLFLIVIVAVMLLLFVACKGGSKEIPVPENLAVDNNVLTWDAIVGAISYDIKVDDNVYTSEENKYSLPIADYAEHEISVRVTTYDGTSKYSASIVYKRLQNKTTLPQLSAPRISMTGNRVMWSTVLNNAGYKIYFDGKTYLAPKNSTYYDLTFSKDGRFEITMQTLGDGVSYATSTISSAYMVTVREGKAPLQSLPKVEFSFNAEEKVIEWRNRYSADAVSYEIYQDNSPIPLVTVPADATKTRQTYAPTLLGGRVSYSMRLISNNGLYNASAFNDAITFPIADAAPAGLAVLPETEQDGYFIEWSPRVYQDGYVVEIDGNEYPVTESLSMAVPTALAAGRHVVRVKTSGNGVYYQDSLYSGGVVFYTKDQGRMTTPLDIPDSFLVSMQEDAISVSFDEVENAAFYLLCFEGRSGDTYLTATENSVIITADAIGSRQATQQEISDIARIRSDLQTGVRVSVAAIPQNDLFEASPFSVEKLVATEEVSFLDAPLGLRYDNQGLAWTKETGTEYVYELSLDGEIKEIGAGSSVSIKPGKHLARLRKKGQNALWSEELIFRAPLDLAAPSGLSENSGVLSFTGSEYATAYVLYSNGSALATLYPSESMILLSSYIKTDGNYVLSLQAVSSGSLNDSPMSEEYLYVKTDGAYGTESKPFVPRSAAEFLSLMRDNAGAYFELIAGGVYDFANYDFSTVPAFDFNGVIRGNGATVKGLKLTSPLFNALNGATIRNLTIEADITNYASSQGGVLAQSARQTVLADMTVKISGETSFARSATFGVLFYGTDDVTVRNVILDYDVSLSCGENCAFGAVAYDAKGSFLSLTMRGDVSVNGFNTRFGGLGVTGNATVSGFAQSLVAEVKGTNSVLAAGCLADGTVTAASLSGGLTLSLDAPIVTYCGVAQKGVSLSDSTLGGTVRTMQATEASLYGVAKADVSLLKNTTVASELSANATDDLQSYGFAETIEEDVDTTGSSFVGKMDLVAAEETSVTAANFANVLRGEHTLRATGAISLTGGKALLSSGAINAQDLILQNQSKFALSGVPYAQALGAAWTGRAISVVGSQEIQTENCGEIEFAGVAYEGDLRLDVQNYRVFGRVEADSATVGGILENANDVDFAALSLTVDIDVISPDLCGVGALVTANSLTLPQTVDLSVNIDGVGSGRIAGFALNLPTLTLSDLSVAGALSLKGDGALHGVAQSVGSASNVSSSASLSAEGDVVVYGLFERVTNADNVSLCGSTVTIRSNDGEYYGLAANVSSNKVRGATVSDVTLSAEPLSSEGESTVRIFGMFDSLAELGDASVSGVTYTIGEYDSLLFGGLASVFSTSVQNGAVVYSLNSSAKDARIGGAFLEGNGSIVGLTLGGASPLTLTSSGKTRLGGLIAEAGDVSVSRGSTYLNVSLPLAAEGESMVGGAFGTLATNHAANFTDHTIKLTVSRTGSSRALIGGAVAQLSGRIGGVCVEADITSAVASDLIGGVAATSASSAIENCVVKGSVDSCAAVGGLVGSCTGGTVNGAMIALTVRSTGDAAGGVFSTAKNTTILNVGSLSRLVQNGYGFFKSGENLSMDFCYFAGEAHSYSLADSASNCAVSSILVDASLRDLSVAREGTIACDFKTLGYGYTGGDLGNDFVVDGIRYPYVAATGYPLRNVTAGIRTLDPVAIAGTVDLYTELNLPGLYDAITPSVTWVDNGNNLEIADGVASVTDNGSGVLYGVLAGGVRVYSVEYTSSGFIPLSGEGTEESPYSVSDLKYLHHVVSYAHNNPTAYFKLDVEGGVLENATFDTLFTAAEPFKGTFDFNNVEIVSPTIGADGILGYLDGATVKNLVLTESMCSGCVLARTAVSATIENVSISGAVTDDCALISSLTDCVVNGVTVNVDCVGGGKFALFENVTGGTLEDLSARYSANTGSDVEFYLIEESSSVSVQKAQASFFAQAANAATAALIKQDQGSNFASVMFVADVWYADAEASQLAGFAFTANGTSFENSAAILAGSVTIYPLVKTGTATFVSVNVLSEAEVPATTGVTALTVGGASTALASMTDFVSGALYTPLGFALLEDASADHSFTLNSSSIELTEALTLSSAFVVMGEQQLSRMVEFTFTGDCAVIKNGVLRPKSTGTGVLTVTNVYGESADVAVTVTYDGFAMGEGTEDDPYLIETFDDFKRLSSYRDGSYFLLKGDVSGTIEEPLSFNGILSDPDGHTVTVDLAADTLFETGCGVIDGVNFVVTKTQVEKTGGGIFMDSANSLTIKNAAIRITCAEVVLSGDTVFGVVFGEMNSCSLQSVVIEVSSIDITAEDGVVGIVAGTAEETLVNDLTVQSDVTLSASGFVTFGTFGSINATSVTYLKRIGENEDDYINVPYAEDIGLDLTLSAQGNVTVGGFAGTANVQITDLDGTVTIDITDGDVVVGGAVGVLNGVLTECSLEVIVTVDGVGAVVGGLVGTGEEYSVRECALTDVSVTVNATGVAVAGGIVGAGSGSVTDCSVVANVQVSSSADAEQTDLISRSEQYPVLAAAGGVGGSFGGIVSRVSVSVVNVTASSAYVGEDLYVLAGGIGGKLYGGNDLEVKGSGTVSATGGTPVAAGVCAVLNSSLSNAVVSGVTLSATNVGWAVGVASAKWDGTVDHLFATIGFDGGALVGSLVNEAQMQDCAYLYGQATLTPDTGERVIEVQKLASLEAFYEVTLYADLDAEIWSIDGASIPSLK